MTRVRTIFESIRVNLQPTLYHIPKVYYRYYYIKCITQSTEETIFYSFWWIYSSYLNVRNSFFFFVIFSRTFPKTWSDFSNLSIATLKCISSRVCVCVHVRWRWHTTEFAFRLINFRYLVHEGSVARWMIRTNDTKSSSSPNDEKISNYLQLLRQNLRTICTLIGFHRAQGNNRWPARCTFARSERGRSGRARGSEFN